MIQPYSTNDLKALAKFAGRFTFEVKEPDGRVLRSGQFPNSNPLAALNHALSVILVAGAQVTTWYLGLINNSPSPSLSSGDTGASHAGWTELTAYTEAVRQTWIPGAVAGQSVTNPTAAAFTVNASVAIYGAFLISVSTKGASSGTIWATGAFPQVQNLTSGQILSVNYSSTAAAA